ncbi:MAG TPA: helix-turn-helix domain-containing protein [Ktedonobacteraceae bacterium]|nr:helix-turn-helix domain-containing protein [Ktedonobacteraceae bacterium]
MKPLNLRELTQEEGKIIARWRHARTVSAGLRQRATIIGLAADGLHAPAIAEQVQLDDETVRRWIKRFNEEGVEGLKERPRSGRPATYSQEEVSLIMQTALTDPQTLDLPFASWTLDRLVSYLKEKKGLQMKRSRLGELLLAGGLRWRKAPGVAVVASSRVT